MEKISLITDTIASCVRAVRKTSILQTELLSIKGISIPEFKLAPKLESDIVQISAKTKPTELVPADNKLFSRGMKKPAFDFTIFIIYAIFE